MAAIGHSDEFAQPQLCIAAKLVNMNAAKIPDCKEQADGFQAKNGGVPQQRASRKCQHEIAQKAAADIANRLSGKVGNALGPDIKSGGFGHDHLQHKTQVADCHQSAAQPQQQNHRRKPTIQLQHAAQNDQQKS